MKVYRDEDADLSLLRGRKVAILGFGNQLHLGNAFEISDFR